MSNPKPGNRHDWLQSEALYFFEAPFNDLLCRAHHVHRLYFNPREVQISTLLSIKTVVCPEDCKYCPQSVRYDAGVSHKGCIHDAGRRHLLDQRSASCAFYQS